MKKAIYLDYTATTPMSQKAVEAMLSCLTENFANPHAVQHSMGKQAHHIVEEGRKSVANFLGVHASEIIFTSGATESNNLAIQGVMKNALLKGKNHLITSIIEHPSVFNVCRSLEKEGFDVTYLKVNSDGLVNLETLEKSIKPETALVSIMAVNNEMGAIQPMQKISEICHKKGVLFHTDAAQFPLKFALDSYNKMPFGADILTLSAHKMYGPKGVGALYIRRQSRVQMSALFHGGGQEKCLRSGTVPVALVAGFSMACADGFNKKHLQKVIVLNKIFMEQMHNNLSHISFLGAENKRVPHILNMYIENIEFEALSQALENICLSFGSACSSGRYKVSRTLKALGYHHLNAVSMRISLSHLTTEEDVLKASHEIIKCVNRLRAS